MAEFTLDAIKQESEKRYGSTVIATADGKITFRALLRLPDDDLRKVQQLINRVNEISQAGEETFEAVQEMNGHMHEALQIACGDAERYAKFCEGLDRADLLTVFEYWSNGTQPGEASA